MTCVTNGHYVYGPRMQNYLDKKHRALFTRLCTKLFVLLCCVCEISQAAIYHVHLKSFSLGDSLTMKPRLNKQTLHLGFVFW